MAISRLSIIKFLELVSLNCRYLYSQTTLNKGLYCIILWLRLGKSVRLGFASRKLRVGPGKHVLVSVVW